MLRCCKIFIACTKSNQTCGNEIIIYDNETEYLTNCTLNHNSSKSLSENTTNKKPSNMFNQKPLLKTEKGYKKIISEKTKPKPECNFETATSSGKIENRKLI